MSVDLGDFFSNIDLLPTATYPLCGSHTLWMFAVKKLSQILKSIPSNSVGHTRSSLLKLIFLNILNWDDLSRDQCMTM